ncbi:MliC family protein [Microvirga massiliensis]|uniref:MliC family protein n=1 Tax=Microvirga massiliensis TaxID=1033741 RepID=UPI00093B4226
MPLDTTPKVLLRIISVISLSLLAGRASATEVRYSCADGRSLTAIFSPLGAGPGSVRLSIAGLRTEITLPQVLSADGGRYASDGTEFWIKGNGARLTLGGSATACDAMPN